MARVLSGKAHGDEAAMEEEEKYLLQPDILLKLTALSILPSHSLRQLGNSSMGM